MTGATAAKVLRRGDDATRCAVARESLIAQGHTRCEVDEMPDELVAELAGHAIVHTCSCGRAYDEAGWESAPLVGYQDMRRYGCGVLEMKNCACHSTMTREVT